jgi:glycosyltransferase involved in cell wall biosynthesis
MFSIVIPTFNNINYLKICLSSLRKNSNFDHEIIVHVNEGIDGTVDYLKKAKYNYTYCEENKGVCVAFNMAAKKSTKEYIVLGHDDMYFCPDWDLVFANELKKINTPLFFLSGTMVQPFKSYIELDCGTNYNTFNEKKLLMELPTIQYKNFQGTHWQPSLIKKDTWNKVGGFSEEFSPGLGSDPDFNFKLWNIGCRIFKGLGDCRVYHFSSQSLRKKAWNDGSKIFLMKWGITIKFFKKFYLKTNKEYIEPLKDPNKDFNFFFNLLLCKLKFFYYKILK